MESSIVEIVTFKCNKKYDVKIKVLIVYSFSVRTLEWINGYNKFFPRGDTNSRSFDKGSATAVFLMKNCNTCKLFQ